MSRPGPFLALVGVTAIWGVTFVQVQDALALYPLFAFLAVRFAISSLALAPVAWSSLRTLPRGGFAAGIGVGALLAAAYGLQTAGLELTTVASTGFITGLYVVFTPLLALALFGTAVPRVLWAAVVLAVAGLLLLNGVPGGSALGNGLVLANAVVQAFQITAMERYAPRYDPRALTFLQMTTSFVGFAVIAIALGQLEVPRGWTVWGALLVTGLFAGALGYLIATWVQAQTTAARAALVFTLEAPFAALFGVLLADEVLGLGGLARVRRDDARHPARRAGRGSGPATPRASPHAGCATEESATRSRVIPVMCVGVGASLAEIYCGGVLGPPELHRGKRVCTGRRGRAGKHGFPRVKASGRSPGRPRRRARSGRSDAGP